MPRTARAAVTSRRAADPRPLRSPAGDRRPDRGADGGAEPSWPGAVGPSTEQPPALPDGASNRITRRQGGSARPSLSVGDTVRLRHARGTFVVCRLDVAPDGREQVHLFGGTPMRERFRAVFMEEVR